MKRLLFLYLVFTSSCFASQCIKEYTLMNNDGKVVFYIDQSNGKLALSRTDFGNDKKEMTLVSGYRWILTDQLIKADQGNLDNNQTNQRVCANIPEAVKYLELVNDE